MTADETAATDRAAEGLKWLTLITAISTAVLTFAGVATTEIARMVRLAPRPYLVAFLLILGAIASGAAGAYFTRSLRRQIIFGVAGLCCFVGGTGYLLYIHATTSGIQERPHVTASVETADTTKPLSVKFGASASGLKADEYLFILVQGANAQDALSEYSIGLSATNLTPVVLGEYSRQTIYVSRIGASPDGKASIEQSIPVMPGLYDRIEVKALLGQGKEEGDRREKEAWTGVPVKVGQAWINRFACNNTSKDLACATVLMPAPPTRRNAVGAIARSKR